MSSLNFEPSDGIDCGKEDSEASTDNLDTLDDVDDSFFPDFDKTFGELPEDKKDKIELNDNDLRCLQETLAGYPLDLRIACEEIIAEQDVRHEQMVRLIRNLIRGATARETAALVSEIQEKPITIPKGFEKSSVEELEAWKSSFSYLFLRNILPMQRLVTLIALVAGSIFYFVWK